MPEHRATTVRRRALALVASLTSAVVAGVLLPASAGATTPPPRRMVSGWGYFTSTTSGGMPSLAANADLFTDVSPFWYAARWTGSTSTIAAPYAYNKATVLPAIRATGVKVLPTITDGMPARRMAAVMAGSSSRATFVGQIVSLVTSNGFDGIDLDFESFAFVDGSSTWSSTRPAWDAFIAALSAGLHARGKMLSVTVPAGTETSSDSTGYWVYDWSAMGRYADRVRIMAYDYSPSTPGPIAPFWWVDRVAAHAVTQIPSGKVQIGVPAYGRDWYLSTSGTCPTLPPVGSSSSQSTTFFSDITWARQRHTFNSSGGAGYVSGLFKADAASLPSGSIVTSPSTVSSSFDSTGGERTFPYTVTFNGQSQPATVSTTAVGGVTGQNTVLVGSAVGITVGMAVTGSSAIPGGTTVSKVDGNVLTLSAANTGMVTGLLTFTGTTVVAATGDSVAAPSTLVVPSGTAVAVGDGVSGTGIAAGTTVTAIAADGVTLTLSQPLAPTFVSGEQVTFAHAVSTTVVGGLQGATTIQLASLTGVSKGAILSGANIAAGATVVSVSGNTATVSVASTGTITGTVRVKPAPVAQSCTVSRVGWYSDAQAVAQTATLVGKYRLLGIAEWTVGGEDPGQWSRLRSYATVIAPLPTAATISAPSRLYVGRTGRVIVRVTSAGQALAGASVVLLWQRAGTTSWARVATVTTGATGVASAITPPAAATGTWRAYVVPTWARLASGASASPTVVVKAPAVLALSAPSSVRAGTAAVARVRVTSLAVPVAGLAVTFRWRAAGTTAWVPVRTVLTDRSGSAAASRVPVTSGTWIATFGGSAAQLPGSSNVATTSLVPVISVASTWVNVRRGHVAYIHAAVRPAGPGQIVVAQRKEGTRWVSVARLRTDRFGRVAYRLLTSRQGAAYYRLVVPRTTSHLVGVSPTVRVVVR